MSGARESTAAMSRTIVSSAIVSSTIVSSAIVSSAIVSREPRLAARRHDAVSVVFGDHELGVHAERGGAGAGAMLLQRPRLRVLEPHLGVITR